MFAKTLPLWTGILPLIAVHVSYGIAAWLGHVPWCNPYWDACTSISAAGREAPEYYWFKITMIPAALLMIVYWQRMSVWLRFLGNRAQTIRWLGFVGAAFLMLYVIALGVEGDLFRWQRRIGVILYFTLTYLAQLLVVSWLWRHGYRQLSIRIMFLLCILCLLIGLTSLGTDLLTDWHDDVADAYEWVLALLINTFLLVSYWAWKATHFDGTSIREIS